MEVFEYDSTEEGIEVVENGEVQGDWPPTQTCWCTCRG